MIDLVLDLIDFNEGINYVLVSKVIIIYLILLWCFVSVWVFNDARSRFSSKFIAVVLALVNLILSFPFLLIYLLIRPSTKDGWEDSIEDGGVNIPIVNFTKKGKVMISLQLQIDSKSFLDKDGDEYKFDISLKNKDGSELKGNPLNDALVVNESRKLGLSIKSFFEDSKTKIKTLIRRSDRKVEELKVLENVNGEISQDDTISSSEENQKNKSRKEKKKMKKKRKK